MKQSVSYYSFHVVVNAKALVFIAITDIFYSVFEVSFVKYSAKSQYLQVRLKK